ncbi:hypothetical protein LTR56_012161 [Elasticomyces elasticus]|nr:hypothetical protein LTR56_012161 [Elasticomyces elasticus]KAK3663634.1 hypothetical protein LTR22_005576 [Elasticomyces elasticus]KAK4921754.1 hypothetical protein LTR49_010862 [Elasticomyces elasticus]KAK5764170.1 hypothetical protein LTS12_005619 [Elasticomyces elasticus]
MRIRLSAEDCLRSSQASPPVVQYVLITRKQNDANQQLKVDMLIPGSSLERLKAGLVGDSGKSGYARVFMKIGELIEGDFFKHYVKTGNIVMLSEGGSGIDHKYALNEGVLRLEVDKATFERMGLGGQAIPSEGRHHVKARYAIEINLRVPSMVRGKPGFDRIVWAFKNVLDRSVTWLFHDLNGTTDGTGPIAVHQPMIHNLEPVFELLENVGAPAIPLRLDHAAATELLEWLTMAANLSPRLQQTDSVDSYLSRYETPRAVSETGKETTVSQGLVRIRWHGFISASFISFVFSVALKECPGDWVALIATSFGGEAIAIVKDGERTMTWEYAS